MPFVIESKETRAISLDDFFDYAHRNVDPGDCDSMIEAGDKLKALGNNRSFLAEFITQELKRFDGLQGNNQYSPQVVMLRRGEGFFIRANIWPGKNDYLTQINGEKAFFYHTPHDHNFNFLTVGYYGPGYKSNYYVYDYSKVVGYPGEKVDLKFVELSGLELGKVMLYRACYDVHDQLPGDSLSISINLMEDTLDLPYIKQYEFDLGKSTITGLINRNSNPAIIAAAGALGDGNTLDVLHHLAERHPCSRTKLASYLTLSQHAERPEQRFGFLEAAAKASDRYVAKIAQMRLEKEV